MLNSKILVWQRGEWMRKVSGTVVALGAGCRRAFSLPGLLFIKFHNWKKTVSLLARRSFWIFTFTRTFCLYARDCITCSGVTCFLTFRKFVAHSFSHTALRLSLKLLLIYSFFKSFKRGHFLCWFKSVRLLLKLQNKSLITSTFYFFK